jgi:AcrR family transcriptional regulator
MVENRKTLYTRSVIKDSLYELLEQKPLSKVTVKELCHNADINRSTFYSHYKDVYDLVEQLEDIQYQKVMDAINEQTLLKQNQTDTFITILTVLKEMEHDLKLIELNPDSMVIVDKMIKKVSEYIRPVLTASFTDYSERELDHVFHFISQGCFGLVSNWVLNGMKESPSRIAELMEKSLNGFFNNYQ